MTDLPPPTLRLRIDSGALASNWRALDALSGKARAGAAVKADCYGLRVNRCVPVLRDAGCRDFFVAHWSEVPAVLAHVPADRIAVLHGPLTADEVGYARATGVRPVIDSLRQAKLWNEGGGASLANSAGIALGSDYGFDLTRPGLSLYGGIQRAELQDKIGQVVHPQAALIQTREIDAGETVGYNATFTARQRMRVGVVSLGYADGILRSWGGAHFIEGDRRLPILGKVSMDMIVLDLSEAPELTEGDWVELPYHLPDAAQQTAVSQYELLTLLGNRFG